ncbi:MAG: choice-of-anchor D domain-containing protein [Terriglobales bacterium]
MVRLGVVIRSLILCGLALTTLAFAKTNKNNTIATYPTFGVSQPVADMPVEFSMFPFQQMPEPRSNPNKLQQGPYQTEDPVWQKEAGRNLDVTVGLDFDGIASNGYAPSDSNMAVGPNQIVEVVNVLFQVFNKTGGTIAGPTNIQNIFAGLPGDCSTSTYGDPVVLYDRAADRWLLSMIGSGSTTSECIAVSKTNDPTGAYYLYGYSFGANLNDYPKLGTWATASNSAYLATYDIFINFSSFGGSDLCGLDRTKMLAGNASAAELCQMTPSSEFSYLPSDMDGPTPPADGTPGLFIHPQGPNQLYLRTLTLNFASGTATMSAATKITVPSFTEACHSSCVPQSGTTERLDALGDLTMYRFPVRHFADHDRALVNDSVIVTGSQVGVRWYELYDPAGAVTLNQSGTYAPDASYRWMASAAEDKSGDIAIGYSASSSTIHPANRFAGRVPSDPAGSLESEISIVEGGGSEGSGLSRWGDYSALQVDPTDDCTFWYVAQYEAVTGTFNWHTRIASWSFPGCGGTGGGPAISFTPASLKWGKVPVGTTKGQKKVTITNTGDATLTISSITTSGDFGLVPVVQTKKKTPCVNGTNLAPGATCLIRVSFSPTQVGARTGSVNFTDNAPDSPQAISLTGTGK